MFQVAGYSPDAGCRAMVAVGYSPSVVVLTFDYKGSIVACWDVPGCQATVVGDGPGLKVDAQSVYKL